MSGFVFIQNQYSTRTENKKAVQHFYCTASLEILTRRQPTFPLVCSIIGAGGLNGRVRNGNGCGPSAMVTGIRLTTGSTLVLAEAERCLLSCQGTAGTTFKLS